MANYAKSFSKQVGVGKMYLQSEANAYRARAAALDMDAAEIARREFQAGRALSDAELKGQAAPVAPAPPTAAPAPPTAAPAPPTAAPSNNSYVQTIQQSIPATAAPEPAAAPMPEPTASAPAVAPSAPVADGSAAQGPLVIPITYGPPPVTNAPASTDQKSIPEHIADSAVSVLIDDVKKHWPFYVGGGLFLLKLLKKGKRK